MSEIIHLNDDPHRQTQKLLPWYGMGTLDPGEAAIVEAHLRECADCRAELQSDRVLAAEIASLPIEVDYDWMALRERVDAVPVPRAPSWFRRPIPVGWALAGQLAAAALILAIALPGGETPAEPQYTALGSATEAPVGNIIILFEPETTERNLRAALERADARLVDGPTASGAYILNVTGSERARALKQLQSSPQVILAEPIDAGGPP